MADADGDGIGSGADLDDADSSIGYQAFATALEGVADPALKACIAAGNSGAIHSAVITETDAERIFDGGFAGVQAREIAVFEWWKLHGLNAGWLALTAAKLLRGKRRLRTDLRRTLEFNRSRQLDFYNLSDSFKPPSASGATSATSL